MYKSQVTVYNASSKHRNLCQRFSVLGNCCLPLLLSVIIMIVSGVFHHQIAIHFSCYAQSRSTLRFHRFHSALNALGVCFELDILPSCLYLVDESCQCVCFCLLVRVTVSSPVISPNFLCCFLGFLIRSWGFVPVQSCMWSLWLFSHQVAILIIELMKRIKSISWDFSKFFLTVTIRFISIAMAMSDFRCLSELCMKNASFADFRRKSLFHIKVKMNIGFYYPFWNCWCYINAIHLWLCQHSSGIILTEGVTTTIFYWNYILSLAEDAILPLLPLNEFKCIFIG